MLHLKRSPTLRRRTLRPTFFAVLFIVTILFFVSHSVNYTPTREYPSSRDRLSLYFAQDGLVKGLGVHSRRSSAEHPIDELIYRGQRRWDSLLRRQSKTLGEAVSEYRHRYARDPPAGFDRWFAFCQEHGVKIIDDYDQIDRDMRIWLAVKPDEFRRRVAALDTEKHKYTITLSPNGSSSVGGDMSHGARAKEHHNLLAPLAPLLDREVRLVISNHDVSSHILNDGLKQTLLNHVAAGTTINSDELKRLESPKDFGLGLLVVCPEDSPARRMQAALRAGTVSAQMPYVEQHDKQTAFVYDARPKMNFCDAPELLDLHGAFSWHNRRHCNLRPMFQQCKLAQSSDMLLTPLVGVLNASSAEGRKTTSKWEDKTIHKVFWRGSMTGDHYSVKQKNRETYDWRHSHRPRLHLFANNGTGEARVWVRSGEGWEQKSFRRADLNEKYLDVGLAGKATQCNEDDGTCGEMNSEIAFKGRVSSEDAKKYAYVLDTDGNGWSSRFHRLLSSGSVVIKTTIYPEWMSDWLTPWVHYVPVQTDYSDLYDSLSYRMSTDGVSRNITESAIHFAHTYWRWEDMQAYMLRMLLEYARLGADDRAAASYQA
ncbi:hypothetical protein CspHIS471_0303190 [Cutaneotrichosporon sp. HIS471]|nr:hypothetical protein CspHIS471_0303190 [Cutaneotrichosporon sp. HIS471]